MTENLDISCPVLYLGQVIDGRLNGGFSIYLPDEICLYFANIYPQSGIHIFVNIRGIIRIATTKDLFSPAVWIYILGKQDEWLQSHFEADSRLPFKLARYFGIEF